MKMRLGSCLLFASMLSGCADGGREADLPQAGARELPRAAWAHAFTGGFVTTRVAVAPDGDVVVAGGWRGGPLALDGIELLPAQDGRFLARFDAEGGLRWARPLGRWGETWLAVSETGIAVAGICNGAPACELDAGGGVLGGAEGRTTFVALLDAEGGHRWSTALTASDYMESDPGIALGPEDGVILVNSARGTVPVGASTLTSDADGDPFLVRFDAAGAVKSARMLKVNDGDGIGFALMPGPAGSVFLAATVGASIDFGDGVARTAGGARHLVVARIRADDSVVWAHAFAGEFIGWSYHRWSANARGELALSGLYSGALRLPTATLRTNGFETYAVVLDLSTGVPQWADSFGTGSGAAVIADDGDVVGAVSEDGDCRLLRDENPGAVAESAVWGDGQSQFFIDAMKDRTGGMIATGSSDSAFSLDGIPVGAGAFVARFTTPPGSERSSTARRPNTRR